MRISQLLSLADLIEGFDPPYNDETEFAPVVSQHYVAGLAEKTKEQLFDHFTLSEISQKKLARYFGITESAVHQWLKGKGIKGTNFAALVHLFPEAIEGPIRFQERHVAGVIAGMCFIRREILHDSTAAPLARQSFACFLAAYISHEWKYGNKDQAVRDIIAEVNRELNKIWCRLLGSGMTRSSLEDCKHPWNLPFMLTMLVIESCDLPDHLEEPRKDH